MNFARHESTDSFNETRHRVESSTSGDLSGALQLNPTDFGSALSRCMSALSEEPQFLKSRGIHYAKDRKTGEFRNKHMKPRITINEMSRKQTDVVLWRRFGCGGWFLVQTASLASDCRNHRLFRLPRAPEMRRPRLGL